MFETAETSDAVVGDATPHMSPASKGSGIVLRLMEHSNISGFCWELVTQNGSSDLALGRRPEFKSNEFFVNHSRCADTEV